MLFILRYIFFAQFSVYIVLLYLGVLEVQMINPLFFSDFSLYSLEIGSMIKLDIVINMDIYQHGEKMLILFLSLSSSPSM